MVRETTRAVRGWAYAILIAICLLLIFYVGSNFAQYKRLRQFRDPRTAVLTAASTVGKVNSNIATEDLPLAIEPLDQLLQNSSWKDYRSSSSHSITLMEPPAGIKLLAPLRGSIASEEATYGRSPTRLAEDSAQQIQTNASLVSATRIGETSYTENSNLEVDQPQIQITRRTWPHSAQLRDQLTIAFAMANDAESQVVLDWLNNVATAMENIAMEELRSEKTRPAIEKLKTLTSEGATLSQSLLSESPELASIVARVSYSIERRSSVWSAIHACVSEGKNVSSYRKHQMSNESLLQKLEILERELAKTGDLENWKTYLMLDRIRSIAQQGLDGTESQVETARTFLSRVMLNNVRESQKRILTSPEVGQLADLLHPLTIGPVDYLQLLNDIETLEADPTHRCSRSLSEAMQCLRFSEHPAQSAISQAINSHYRNANIRIAISEDFVNRMFNQQNVTQKPVRQTILGAQTRGASQIATQLKINFEPDPKAWRIGINLNGDINSDTRSSRNGATFYNSSRALVEAAREVRIEPSGFQVDGSPATVRSSDALRKFSTDWDELPFVGSIIRSIAHQEFVESRPIAKRITHTTIAKETDKEFDTQLQNKLQASQKQLDQHVIGPLMGLELHPMIVDMQSTDSRLIVRYRVASEEQTSAHSPRPLAPSDSLVSMQIHQSALNNAACQVVRSDRDWTAQELADQIADILKQPKQSIGIEQADDISVRFHPNNPITVEFENGQLWLTLRIDSFEQPGRVHLKNFTIRTSFNPSAKGLDARLERDGVISVDGHKLGQKDKLALRVIFAKVLANRDSLPVIAESLLKDKRAAGLAVSQLEMRDGWLAVAVSDEKSPHIATVPQSSKNR